MAQLTRAAYAALYGPTTGDRVRLADTDLWIEVEEDRCFGGDEAVFGGGKSIRESMAQSTASRADGAPDLVITNAVVLDHWGVVKTDVGIRDGRIVALGRSGNPDISDGVHPDLVIGPGTDVISGEGRILTAGAVDTHVHFLMPETLHEALATGTTTVIGGGTGATEGSKATTVTPGAFNLAMMHRSLDRVPLNVMLFAKGSTVGEDALREAALDRRKLGLQGPRGLGRHPRRDRRRAPGGRRPRTPSGPARGQPQRGRLRRRNPRRHRRTRHPRLPRRGGGRRPRPRHHHRRLPPQHPPGVHQPDAPAHRQHRRRTPRHAHGVPPPQPPRPRGPRVRRIPDPRHHHRRRGRAARHRRALHHLLRRPGDGPHRRGRLPHLAGRPRHETALRRPRQRPARRQREGPPLRRQVHDLPGRRPRNRPRRRLRGTGKARRSRPLGPRVLRHPARHRHQGRHGRVRAARRRGGGDPHHPARPPPGHRRGRRGTAPLGQLRLPPRPRPRARRTARPGAGTGRRTAHPPPHQGGPAEQHGAPSHRRGPRDLRHPHRRRTRRTRPPRPNCRSPSGTACSDGAPRPVPPHRRTFPGRRPHLQRGPRTRRRR